MFGKRKYICRECGARMKQQDDVLICPKCEHWVELDFYDEEEDVYENIYGNMGNDKYDNDAFWTECDNFPEEFPGVNYEDEDDDEEEPFEDD